MPQDPQLLEQEHLRPSYRDVDRFRYVVPMRQSARIDKVRTESLFETVRPNCVNAECDFRQVIRPVPYSSPKRLKPALEGTVSGLD